MTRRLRILIVTRLFPNRVRPSLAPFNLQQFRALAELCDVRILAVVPWFPGARWIAGTSDAARFTAVPRADVVAGVPVAHPRVFYIPKIGHAVAPALYAASLLPFVVGLRGHVDAVLGSWAFPDGAAAIGLGRLLGVPAVVKVHGSDVNVLAEDPIIRRVLAASLPCADRVVAVSRPLADRVVDLGVSRERVTVVPNGVDRGLFCPRDRATARAELGLSPSGRLVLYVGRLELAKGVGDLLDAFATLAPAHPDVTLALVGGGTEEARCREAAARGPGKILLTGARPLEEVARWIAACDVLTLPSWNEGTPNVVIEAMASGRRVVATRVGGIPDVVTSDAIGLLVPPRDASSLARALVDAAYSAYDPEAIARVAPGDWADSAAALHGALSAAVGRDV